MGSGPHPRIRLTRTPRSGHVGDARGWGAAVWPGRDISPVWCGVQSALVGVAGTRLPASGTKRGAGGVHSSATSESASSPAHRPDPNPLSGECGREPHPGAVPAAATPAKLEFGRWGLQLLGVGQVAAFGRGGASVLCPAAAGSLPARLPGTPTARGALAEQLAILGATVALCRSGDEGTRATPIRHPAPQPREGLNIWRPSCAERPRAGVWFPPDRDSSLPHTSHLGARRGLSPSLEEPTVRSGLSCGPGRRGSAP